MSDIKRTVQIVLSDLDLESKEAALEAAVIAEVLAEQVFSDKQDAFKEAKAAKEGAASAVRTLTREVYQREARAAVTCHWRYLESAGEMRLYRDDTGAMVPGERREATAAEKTVTLPFEPCEPPAVRVVPALPVAVIPTAKQKVLAFMRGSAGGFTGGDLSRFTSVNGNTLRRILPEMLAAGQLTRDDGELYWVAGAADNASDETDASDDAAKAAE